VGLSHPLSENSRILSVEQEVDPGQLDVFVGSVVPVASINGPFGIVVVDENGLPRSGAIFAFPETLTWDRVEGSIWLLTVSDPLCWLTAVVLRVIEGLKREPLSWRLTWS